MDRRGFFKTVLRIGALGGLSVLGVRAMRGAGGSGSGSAGRDGAAGGAAAQGPLPGQTCTSDWICARCASVPGCGLPQALSYRQAKGS